jgi:hypothetical protein
MPSKPPHPSIAPRLVQAAVLPDLQRRRLLAAAALLPLGCALSACGGGSSGSSPPASTRTWKMGFYPNPPTTSSDAVVQLIDQMSSHAELVHIHEELPWTDLLAGTSAQDLANAKLPLANAVRAQGMRLGFMADLTNGLDRSQEPPQLVALGRSITEPQVQQVYRAYVVAIAQVLQPDYVGLNAETNLVRLQATPGVYAASVQAANAAAADLVAADITVPLMISVQVEVAWGKASPDGAYQGIATDLADFPFLQMLGLSSYPYFSTAQPEDLPADYYSRLLNGQSLPAMVAEGGWSSATSSSINSSPDLQRRYLGVQATLLDSIAATAVVQTLFADLDLASLPASLADSLVPFADIGLTNSDYSAKPALGAWDALFLRSRT